jgi:cyclopropane fatty-acyl-phospholipid synthase-like methyltransferase
VKFDGTAWAEKLSVGHNDVVVDLGCGEGKLLKALAPLIFHGIGLDMSAIALERGRRGLKDAGIKNIELRRQDFRKLNVPSSSVKAVVSLWALHHVEDDAKRMVLEKIRDALVPGGLLNLEDDTFNFQPERFGEMVPAMYREFEERFGRDGWEVLKRELDGEDFECTPYLDALLSMIRLAGLDVISVTELGLNGAVVRARHP